jgi:spore maturation protein CgeB
MNFVFFTHSLVSDWNHGNAHFQRGVMRELIARGHRAVAWEPEDGWSRRNLLAEAGPAAVARFAQRFPELESCIYAGPEAVEAAVDRADCVIVHEWTDPAVVGRLGALRARGARFRLYFHDTHHRAVTAPEEIDALPLDGYDGVLAFGAVLAETYRRRGWGRAVHVWHEAADLRLFRPMPWIARRADLVWIGNWGDGERTAELETFLIGPARDLGLTGVVHGVRYPEAARARLAETRLAYRGWVANADAPAVFAAHRATVHVPRRPYAERLPGIPTIRVFEALACGAPLVCAPWDDAEGLFRPGRDYLVAQDGPAMRGALRKLIADRAMARELSLSGLGRIRARHSCAHRAEELLAILGAAPAPPLAAEAAL